MDYNVSFPGLGLEFTVNPVALPLVITRFIGTV